MRPKDNTKGTFLSGNGNSNKKFVGPLTKPPFIPGPSNPSRSQVGPNIASRRLSNSGSTSGGYGSASTGGNFNDNVILDTSQVERDNDSYTNAAKRRLAAIRATNKGYK